MVLSELSLPLDIPWKRMGVSRDMIDETAGDQTSPEKWRSSIAVFYHEPEELPPDYCDRRVTYLKIVTTITNFQTYLVLVPWIALKKQFGHFTFWPRFESWIIKSFPCLGALVQVSVLPRSDATVELHDYPYIAAFQPRKRELYESLTQSGEVASQSAGKVDITKGTTNTDTSEDYDLKTGGGGRGFLFGAFSSTDAQGQVGTVERAQVQDQNITTGDASRERRESHSYSTQINQLYTLLQGFHLGSNRALFFLQPRPHMQDTKFTFLRGLRRLEGVQEFFLVVNRPATVPGICVEVLLETAHADLYRAYQPRIIPLSELYQPGNLQKTAAALGINPNGGPYRHHSELVTTWNRQPAWLRHVAVSHHLSGSSSTPARVRRAILLGVVTEDAWLRLLGLATMLPQIGTENVALIFEEYEADSGSLFVIARKLCSCVTPAHPTGEGEVIDDQHAMDCEASNADHLSFCDTDDSVVYESPIGLTELTVGRGQMADRGLTQNEFVREVNHVLASSVASPERLPHGTLKFQESDHALGQLAVLLRALSGHVADRPLADVADLRPFLDRGLGRTSEVRSVLDLARLTTGAVAHDLGISTVEARPARSEILLAGLHSLDADTVRSAGQKSNWIVAAYDRAFPPAERDAYEASALLRDGDGSAARGPGPRSYDQLGAALRGLRHRFRRPPSSRR